MVSCIGWWSAVLHFRTFIVQRWAIEMGNNCTWASALAARSQPTGAVEEAEHSIQHTPNKACKDIWQSREWLGSMFPPPIIQDPLYLWSTVWLHVQDLLALCLIQPVYFCLVIHVVPGKLTQPNFTLSFKPGTSAHSVSLATVTVLGTSMRTEAVNQNKPAFCLEFWDNDK